MSEDDIYLKNINDIVYSKEFRRLKDKTQLFSARENDHYRNRLTHSLEVKCIAFEIANKLKEKLDKINYICNYNLLEAISLGHDIGHTPFGHIGERTIQDIFTREDDLGGMLKKDGEKIFFKHNVNSLRILNKNIKNIHWKVQDGVVKHTSISYKNFPQVPNGINMISTINSSPLYSLNSQYNLEIKNLVDDNLNSKYDSIRHALTIEGQIVQMADEIAQRIADLDDTYRSRYVFQVLDELDNFVGLNYDLSGNNFAERIEKLKRVLIDKLCDEIEVDKNDEDDVVLSDYKEKNVIKYKDIKDEKNQVKKLSDFTDGEKQSGLYLNMTLSNFISKMVAKSEKIRSMDSKASYIIRQLFKAYFNNYEQLSDSCLRSLIEDCSDFLFRNKKNKFVENVINILKIDKKEIEKDYKLAIINSFYIDKYNIKNEKLINLEVLGEIVSIMKNLNMNRNNMVNEKKSEKILDFCSLYPESTDIINKFANIFIYNIGYYIAYMTDEFAIREYKNLYLL